MRVAAWISASRGLKPETISCKSMFWQLSRLTRYTCNLGKIGQLNQGGGEGTIEKEKGKEK